MGETTGIAWADATLNFWIGCRKVSEACAHCYAEADAKRYGHDFSVLRRTSEHLWGAPRRWKEPKRIFVNSWSDFFMGQDETRADVTDWREIAWQMMCAYDHHTYMLLTKRPEVMLAWSKTHDWPAHIWAGVTCESQAHVSRLDALAQVPAKVKFVSVEPMLSAVDLRDYLDSYATCANPDCNPSGARSMVDEDGCCAECGADAKLTWGLSLVIAGGESGPHARPSHPDWFRGLRDQCKAASLPFFFKQWGEWLGTRPEDPKPPAGVKCHEWNGGVCSWRVGRKAAGDLLDGKRYHAQPQEPRDE